MNNFERKLAAQPFREPPTDLRRAVLAAYQPPPRAGWREWLWPAPSAWGALAALWLIFAAVQVTEPPPAPSVPVFHTDEALRASPLLALRTPQQIRHVLELSH